MKTVKIIEIMDYYDGILAFAAQDPIGGHYIGSLFERTSDHDCYLVVGTRPERLADLRNGKVDMRTLLLETPEGEWYTASPRGTIDDPLALVPQPTPLVDSEHLPGDGYFLGPEEPPDESEIRRVLERGKAVALIGRFEIANRTTGEWSLLTDHGITTGKTALGGPGLDGLQVGKRYRFQCMEVTELDPLWRDRKVLYLQRVESA